MRKLLWLISILCIGLGIVNSVHVFQGYLKGRKEYENLREVHVIPPSYSHTESKKASLEDHSETEESMLSLPDDAPMWSAIDFASLKEINSDVIAWIEIPGVDVSYPVLQREDNEYYLHRDIYGEYLFAGSIFMDCFNDPKLRNMNTVIYGHNMNDRSMFGKLREFRDQAFYEAAPYFWIYTMDGCYLYKIFSVHLASNGSQTYIVKFLDADNFEKWIQRMTEASEVRSDLIPNITDQFITLSTCTGSNTDKQVVQGLLVAEVKNDTVIRIR